MTEEMNNQSEETASSGGFRESAHRVWLAGLGAVAVAEEGGSRLFHRLVEKGEGLEARNRERVDRVKERVETKWGELGDKFDTKVATTLERLGVPNRDEMTRLRHKIEELEQKLKELNSAAG